MHPRNLAAREEIAIKSLTQSARKLAKAMGQPNLADGIAQATHKDPNIANMRRLEAVALFMEALIQGSKAEGQKNLKQTILAAADDDLIAIPGIGEKSLTSIREWAAQEDPSPVIEPGSQVTVETVEEKPLETTETVEVVPAEDVTVTGTVDANTAADATVKTAGKSTGKSSGTAAKG